MVSSRERCTRKCTSPRVLSRSDFEQRRARRRKNGIVILRRTFENACTRASRVRTPGNTWRDPGDCSFAHPPTLPRLMCSKFLSLSPFISPSLSLYFTIVPARGTLPAVHLLRSSHLHCADNRHNGSDFCFRRIYAP